jgi:hypothetical protein
MDKFIIRGNSSSSNKALVPQGEVSNAEPKRAKIKLHMDDISRLQESQMSITQNHR